MLRKVKRRTQGRTFGGVAACPHCSSPIRLFVTMGRTQCVVDVVSVAYSLPYVPLEEPLYGDLVYGDPVTATPNAGVAGNVVSGITPTGARGAAGDIDAPLLAHPGERGFDDDEAPSPQQRTLVLR